jgi:hypothetical protein
MSPEPRFIHVAELSEANAKWVEQHMLKNKKPPRFREGAFWTGGVNPALPAAFPRDP